MDEIYTYINKKSNRYYIFTAIGYIKQNIFCFISLKDNNNINGVQTFINEIPKAKLYYSDGLKSYKSVLKNFVISKKSKITNIIESVNSSIRNSISYLNRRQKSYAKSFINFSDACESIIFNLNYNLNLNIILNGFHKNFN